MDKKTQQIINVLLVLESCLLVILDEKILAIWAMLFAMYHYQVSVKHK